MWILKNSQELLDNLKTQAFLKINSKNSFDFTTLYTTIPNDKLKSKFKEIINQCFFHKNRKRRSKYVVLDYTKTYFVKDQPDVATKYYETDVIRASECWYIDDVLSLNNSKFSEYLDFIYQSELEIKETTESATTASLLDCFLYMDNRKLSTWLSYFSLLRSNIPSAPAYGVYVSQLIHYTRVCSKYEDFADSWKLLTTRLLAQGYLN